ncbi:MAG: hypothetical protein CMJ83_04255 [Planctomycetes bacterium]|nr:hypothetical protein [Planctomycetota bacterium]
MPAETAQHHGAGVGCGGGPGLWPGAGLVVGVGMAILEAGMGAVLGSWTAGAWASLLFLLVALGAGTGLTLAGELAWSASRLVSSRWKRPWRIAATASGLFALTLLSRPLFEGPRARELPYVTLYPFALATLAVVVLGLSFRVAESRPRITGLVALLGAAASFACDALFFRGHYPTFHLLLAIATPFGLVTGALLVVASRPRPAPSRVLRWSAAAVLVCGALALFLIARSPGLRTELVLRTVQLRRVVFLLPSVEGPVVSPDAVNETSRAYDFGARSHAIWTRRLGETKGRPILLITLDAWRADRGPGSDRVSDVAPGLERWARGGVVFQKAYSPAVTTFISGRSILTGRYPDTFLASDVLPPVKTVARELKGAGYRTYLWSGVGIFKKPSAQWIPGLDGAFDEIAQNLDLPEMLRRLKAVQLSTDGRPWFAWLHAMEIHHPYDPPPGFSRGSSMEDLYDGQIRHVDQLLAPALDELGDETWVFLTADHGEDMPREHGFASHGSSLYEPSIRVPLVVCGGGIGPRAVPFPVSLVDLFPTFLGLAGVEMPPPSDGLSLLPTLFGDDLHLAARDVVFAERRFFNTVKKLDRPMRAMMTRDSKIVVSEEPRTLEAYDLTRDPEEKRNLFLHDTDRADVLRTLLRRRYLERMKRWDEGRDIVALNADPSEPGYHEGLLGLYRSGSPATRLHALKSLALSPVPRLKSVFVGMTTGDPREAAWAAVGLGTLIAGRGPWPAALALEGPDDLPRELAILELIKNPRPETAPLLMKLVDPKRPSATYRPVIALNKLGHRSGMTFLDVMLQNEEVYLPGLWRVISQQPDRPRPELPGILEDHIDRYAGNEDAATAMLVALAKAPGERALRVIDALRQSHGTRVVDGKSVDETLAGVANEFRRTVAREQARLRGVGEGDDWRARPFAVAWGMVDGINFVIPPPRALNQEEWGAPSEATALRPLASKRATIRIPIRHSGAKKGVLQLLSAKSGRIRLTFENQIVLDAAVRAGTDTKTFVLPRSVPAGGTAEFILEVGDIPFGHLGFRELALIKAPH